METLYASFQKGPFWFYVVGGVGLGALATIILQIYLEGTGRRVSPLLWWVGPASVAAVSLGVVGFGLPEAPPGLDEPDAFHAMRTNVRRLAYYYSVAAFGAIVQAVACCVVAIGVWASVWVDERDSTTPPTSAGIAALLTVVALCIGVPIYVGFYGSLDRFAYLVVAVVAAGGLAAALLARRVPDGGEGAEYAYERWSAALALFVATGAASWASTILRYLEGFKFDGGGTVANFSKLSRVFAEAHALNRFGWFAMAIALVVGGLTVASAGWRAFGGTIVKRLGMVVLLWLPAVAMGWLTLVKTARLLDVGQTEGNEQSAPRLQSPDSSK